MYKMGLKVAGATGETKLKVWSDTEPFYCLLSLVSCTGICGDAYIEVSYKRYKL